MILTAGLGTRLRPLSFVRAKPAVPIAGEPLIRRILRWVAGHDVRQLVLNLHHLPETVTSRVGDGLDLDVRVRYSWESPVLGSAGGPRKALDLLPEDFFIINGDTLTNIDLQALAAHHRQSDALVTMALVKNRWPGRYGGVVTDAGGRVYGFVPAGSPAASYHFPGVQMAHRSVFADLPLNQPTESTGGVYQALMAHKPGSIRAYPCAADFWDVGTPADYLDAALSIGHAEGISSVQIGKDSRVDPSALIADSVIWENVEIGAAATLNRCVVADDVKIPAGASFQNCAIIQQGETLVVSNLPVRGRDTAIRNG